MGGRFTAGLRNRAARQFKAIHDRLFTDRLDRLEALLFPYPHTSDERYCFAASSQGDIDALNALARIRDMKGFPVACDEPLNLNGKYVAMPYDGIVKEGFRTVVIPSENSEAQIESRLRSLYDESGHEFSIWDPYAYFMAGRIYTGNQKARYGFSRKRYRLADLTVSEGNIVLPAYFANWGYINHLIRKEIMPGMSVLDMWAGSGCIGLSLKKERPDITVDLADVNFFAVLGMEDSISRDGDLKGSQAFLSNVFDQMPEGNKYDLIVGNPPCGRGYFSDFIQIGGSDDEWKSHLSFFRNAHHYLKPGGTICIVENICDVRANSSEYVEEFYRDFPNLFPQYGQVVMESLRGSFLSMVTIHPR